MRCKANNSRVAALKPPLPCPTGAGRVVATGPNQQVLSTLHELGADATIRLDAPAEDLGEAFVLEAGDSGFQVAIDYVWGRPAEAFRAAINTQGIFCHHVRDSLGSSWGKRRADYLACSCRAA